VGMVNVGSHAPAYPLFYCVAVREGTYCYTRQTPPIRTRIGSVFRSGDLEITFLTLHPLEMASQNSKLRADRLNDLGSTSTRAVNR
jgi:hypothetical protein